MKKIFSILAGLLLTASVFAQAPQKMSYQAVIRNSSKALITATSVGMKISILKGSATGTAVYVETQTASTNANGLVSVEIGSGTVVTGTFAGIDWAAGPYFIKSETDPTGGTGYTIVGTNELMSVPYALFSANGTPGATGAQGPIGLTGAAGSSGATGTQGPIGLTGAVGPAGAAGAAGAQGIQGLTGSAGAAGTQGIQGIQGLSGSVANVAAISGTSTANGASITSGVLSLAPADATNGGIITTDAQIFAGVKTFNTIITGSINGNATTATTAGNITATTNTTLTTLSSLATVGTITSGVWSGTAVAVEKGGTGATTASAARTNLGLVIGTNVQAPLVAGTDYLVPTGSAASLTNFPTFNQNTTGNAATATTATTATSAGTASTATKLATSRNINGVSFDGSGDITVTADAGTLTGTTLKSTVTGSSLTSVGTIASLTTGVITNSGKVIVGASSAASASAVLEASSTTQGFLPPRLNYYQKTQITSPVAGLTIWCSNCGASGEMQVFNGGAWTNMSGGTATGTISLSIGNSYQGGIVAYILVSGDPGYDANTPHGLIAATSDQSTGIRWYNGSYTTTGATGTAIGTGLSNTNTIVTSQGATSTSYAAGLARAHTGGGYTDWYLPSKDELAKLYAMKVLGFGGFAISYYWSSTEIGTNDAWAQYFVNGFQGNDGKFYADYVRAIRAF